MSKVNRLSIRPIGFVSKYVTGASKMLDSIAVKTARAVRAPPFTKDKERKNLQLGH